MLVLLALLGELRAQRLAGGGCERVRAAAQLRAMRASLSAAKLTTRVSAAPQAL